MQFRLLGKGAWGLLCNPEHYVIQAKLLYQDKYVLFRAVSLAVEYVEAGTSPMYRR
jgi:hypothetical protein